jgi:hypothetical protein
MKAVATIAIENDCGIDLSFLLNNGEPEKHFNFELFSIALKNKPISFVCIPEEYRTYNVNLVAVSNDGLMLHAVHCHKRFYNLCLAAVKQNKLALTYVPEQHKEQIKKELGLFNE